ncbi:MAG: primosomal protein N' [Candidatus Melainabacteria bacterium]|nr:primosomal protein N' [Candidatus Melainabacteria bacterium]MBI3308955.1 primosomal protein N' [Candidatus Melainabacteria bacterium]
MKKGSAVHIPFGRQELNGYVIGITNEDAVKQSIDPTKKITYKSIYGLTYKKPIWDENFLKLAEWISKYYQTNTGTILAASVSSDIFDHLLHEVELLKPDINMNDFNREQRFILEKLMQGKKQSLSYKYLFQKSKINKHKFYQVLNQLKAKNVIAIKTKLKTGASWKHNKQLPQSRILSQTTNQPITLNKEQKLAYETIKSSTDTSQNKTKTFLLHGVTGSGKTEIYLNLINDALQAGKSAIYLVPEIYLIPQTLQRLQMRFPNTNIILWHSHLTKNERLANWEIIQNKENKEGIIILGARSAILAPISNTGIIVIDEFHENTYKQSGQAPRYDAIMVAKERSKIENCPLVLGSATPAVADYYLCLNEHHILKLTKRIEDVPMPKIHIIDLKNEYPKTRNSNLGNELKANIEEALNRKEQIILLLNRRGYSSHLFCMACDYTLFCKNCSVPMVYHKNLNQVICHHCGNYISEIINQNTITLKCPECKSQHFKYFGLGTQQLEEEVKRTFTSAKVIRVDSDQLRRKDEYITLWQEFANHKADILIGTQVVAKGLDIPNITVVGVILADSMLNFPDYISYERTYQLLTQVAGRAGRKDKPGKVFIQTYKTDEPLFQFVKNHDYEGFYDFEIKHRKEFLYPPFTKIIRIIFQSIDEKECLLYANKILTKLLEFKTQYSTPNSNEVQFLGPAPCFFSKLHNKHRYHILCKINNDNLKKLMFTNMINQLPKNVKVEIIIDIDSVNLL